MQPTVAIDAQHRVQHERDDFEQELIRSREESSQAEQQSTDGAAQSGKSLQCPAQSANWAKPTFGAVCPYCTSNFQTHSDVLFAESPRGRLRHEPLYDWKLTCDVLVDELTMPHIGNLSYAQDLRELRAQLQALTSQRR